MRNESLGRIKSSPTKSRLFMGIYLVKHQTFRIFIIAFKNFVKHQTFRIFIIAFKISKH